jgi:hypothetical protein
MRPPLRLAFRYWELRRIWYNVALAAAAFFGYFTDTALSYAVDDRQYLSGPKIMALFLFSAVGANLCYSFAYVFEFWFGGDDSRSRWFRCGRTPAFVSGMILGVVLAFVGGRCIGDMQFTYRGR